MPYIHKIKKNVTKCATINLQSPSCHSAQQDRRTLLVCIADRKSTVFEPISQLLHTTAACGPFDPSLENFSPHRVELKHDRS